MSINCVLDACTVINLIHIDENDFIFKKLKSLNVFISEKVFFEIRSNVFIKLEKQRKGELVNPKAIESRKKEIDQLLTNIRSYQVLDEDISHDLGRDYFDQIKELTKYSKENGEFHSCALALYLSRLYMTKLFFHTDDTPAKNFFSQFFLNQQIGYIEDTADLLLLLYRIDDDFNAKRFSEYLSRLFSEYATEVIDLRNVLRSAKNNMSRMLSSDRSYVTNLTLLIQKLDNFDFSDITIHRDFFQQNRKYGVVNNILKEFDVVFDLEEKSGDLLKKIKTITDNINNIYCL